MTEYLPQWFITLAFGLFGLALGSFGNVVIWRLPRKESLSVPRSHCPSCGSPIAPYDNIPVISYLLLRGKCRGCSTTISVRYPLIELLAAALMILCSTLIAPIEKAIPAALLCYILLLLTAIDIDTHTLPNRLVFTLGGLGALGIALTTFGLETSPLTPIVWSPLIDAGAGILLGAIPAFGIALLYEKLRGVTGFGMGDIKLLFVLGLFLGPYNGLVLPFASVLATLAILLVSPFVKVSAQSKFAFGPFIAASAVIVLFWGAPLWNWYLNLV